LNAHTTPLPSRLAGVLLGLLGGVLCVAFTAYLTVRHVVWPRLDHWRPDIVEAIGRQLGRPVAIDALRPSWEGMHPALEIDGLRIDGPDGRPRLAVAAAYARVSWRSLAWGRPRLAAVRLDAPTLVVERLAPGRIAVAGFELDTARADGGRGLDWLLTQGAIEIDGATVELLDATGGFEPLRLAGVSVRVDNAGRRHQARITAARPGAAADAIEVIGEVFRTPLARPSDWRGWRGVAYVSGRGVDLGRVSALVQALGGELPEAVASARGRLDALAWARFGDGALVDATIKARVGQASASLEAGPVVLDALAAEARLERERDGGRVARITGLSATDARGFSLAADGDAELGFDRGGALRSGWLRLVAFDAAAALDAARRLPLPATMHDRLRDVGLSGQIRDLTLRWTRPDTPTAETRPADRSADAALARPDRPRFDLSATFERLGVQLGETADGRRLPGVGNLAGALRASDHDGRITLKGRKSVLGLPGVFDEPTVPLERLDAEIDWTVADDGSVRVAVPRLVIENADAAASATGQWHSAQRGPGMLDLIARIERLEGRRVTRYLPSRGTTQLREWLDRSLIAGIAEDARIEVRGDLARWPFDLPEQGRFRITAGVRDATLAYAPSWPRLEQIRGDLVVDGAAFEMRAKSAVYEGVRLSEVLVRMPDHHEAVLTIDGRAAGPAQDLLHFVNDSPVAASVSGFTRDLKVGGDARLGLHLVLPLHEPAGTKVAGGVDFAGNDVEIDRTLPPFSAVSGRLEFTDRGITLPELRGTLLGGPIRVEGRSAGEGRMHIDATGAIDADGLRRLLDTPFSRRLQGRTEYKASVDIERRTATLRIESDLVGMASTLPAPFAKPAGEAWPLRLVSQPLRSAAPGARPGERLDLRIGEDIALIVERERDPATDRLGVRRASFALDGEPVLRDSGLAVLVRTRAIDVDAWRAVIGDGELERLERSARVGGATGMSLVPDLVSVVADDLRVAGRDLHDVVLGASRTDGRWRANIASREIEGHFDWRDARVGERIGTLTARFARLVIPNSRIVEVESALSASPNQLPALDVTVEELVLGTLPMGRLELAATNGGTPAQPVWRLDRAVIVNPSARLEARGTWSFVGAPRPGGAPTASLAAVPTVAVPDDPGGRSTALDFELDLKDSGRLLAGLGLKDTMHGGTGSLAGRVQWNGSPVSIDYGSLEGRVQLAVGKGEFLKVDPGAAKLIGVLNMQSLPKRLTGDFRDLFGEGFAFDTIDGQVRIERGIARTDDLHMRGLQAQVKIRGEADLKLETQKLNVEVVPELNAGLASLAVGAMVNPLIGLGSFAAQYALRKPLQDALAYEVDVTGSWADPTVSERGRRTPPRVAPPAE